MDPDEIVASFDRGVLEVRIPKPVKARPRCVSIDVGNQPAMVDARPDNDNAQSTGTEETADTPA